MGIFRLIWDSVADVALFSYPWFGLEDDRTFVYGDELFIGRGKRLGKCPGYSRQIREGFN